jgi:hypothetical protein
MIRHSNALFSAIASARCDEKKKRTTNMLRGYNNKLLMRFTLRQKHDLFYSRFFYDIALSITFNHIFALDNPAETCPLHGIR